MLSEFRIRNVSVMVSDILNVGYGINDGLELRPILLRVGVWLIGQPLNVGLDS